MHNTKQWVNFNIKLPVWFNSVVERDWVETGDCLESSDFDVVSEVEEWVVTIEVDRKVVEVVTSGVVETAVVRLVVVSSVKKILFGFY